MHIYIHTYTLCSAYTLHLLIQWIWTNADIKVISKKFSKKDLTQRLKRIRIVSLKEDQEQTIAIYCLIKKLRASLCALCADS